MMLVVDCYESRCYWWGEMMTFVVVDTRRPVWIAFFFNNLLKFA